jgi:hypothetical protein
MQVNNFTIQLPLSALQYLLSHYYLIFNTNLHQMKKTALLFFSALITVSSFCQELKVDNELIKLDKEIVAKVEKIKDSKYAIPRFNLVNNSGKLLATMTEYTYNVKPGTLGETLYSLVFTSLNDSLQLSYEAFTKIQRIPLFGMKEETYAKFLFKNNLVNKDGTISKDAFVELKSKFPENLMAKLASQAIDKDKSTKALAELTPRDKTKPVLVTEIKKEETTPGKVVEITYEIKQGDVVIGTAIATGHPSAAKDKRAEIDYAPGIVSLDGDDAPLNYNFKNVGGYSAATYAATRRTITTVKDNVAKSMLVIIGKRENEVQTRLDLIKEGAIYLVNNGYL